ncbi:hypothetical protein GCM10009726_37650 [Nocardioides furvisabuli]|uniref:Uncharacterized protein n=1 Tax=Nocardioides furvisabuli TaxID=375542 RepID=A0ABP5JN17_9ACTN
MPTQLHPPTHSPASTHEEHSRQACRQISYKMLASTMQISNNNPTNTPHTHPEHPHRHKTHKDNQSTRA